ncbi:MAG: N-acetylneuraminate synthase family protein [Treponemataceae bacterium]
MINKIEDRIEKGQFVLIAEIGVNYYDIAVENKITPIQAAKLMIKKAAESGIHAVKFQSYKAETLASKNSPYYWDIKEEPTDSQYKLFKKFDSFGKTEYEQLADYSEQCGIEFLSTPFDLESADYLEPIMNVYKISSSDLNNLNFIEYQAKKNKTIILSVGASNLDEIKRSVELIRKYNDKKLILMHCVLEYPTPYEHANLKKILTLKKEFPNLTIGYSDHTKPDANYDVLKTAYNFGATIIEKHYTLNKTLKGNDHYHAMDPFDAKKIIEGIDFIEKLHGVQDIVCLESEKKARENARRSIVATCNIKAGESITKDMLTWKRPGSGINADNYDKIIGKRAVCDIEYDTVLQWNMIR